MQDLKTILETLGIPVAYNHFNTSTNPPFLVYRRESTSNFGADNKVYKKINNYYVELYTEYKNPALEESLESIFNENNIFFEVESEDYIDSEQMYEIVYSISTEEDM
jgi:hypothetical protein